MQPVPRGESTIGFNDNRWAGVESACLSLEERVPELILRAA